LGGTILEREIGQIGWLRKKAGYATEHTARQIRNQRNLPPPSPPPSRGRERVGGITPLFVGNI
jgi:hypothetical protein